MKLPLIHLGPPARTVIARCVRGVAMWLAALLLGLPASAEDLILERAYLEDASRSMTLEEVRSAPVAQRFLPFSGPLNRGYTASATWIRLTLAPAPVADPSMHPDWGYVLRIQPNYLDEIALYDPSISARPVGIVGDRYAVERTGYRSLNHNLPVALGASPKQVWLRLQTDSTSLIHLELLPTDRIAERDGVQNMVSGVYIGSLFVFFCIALLHWLTTRERLMRALALNQLVALLFALSIMGYFRFMFGDDLPGPWLDTTSCVLVVAATSASIYFNWLFISEFGPPRPTRWIMLGLVWLLPLELLMLWAGQVQLTMHLNMVVVTLGPCLFFIAALGCRGWSEPEQQSTPIFSKAGLLVFYGITLLLLIVFALPSLGLIPMNEWTLQSNSIYGFVSGVILILTMQLRARRLQREHLEGKAVATLAHQRAAQEASHRQHQAQFIALLSHELKTPLSVLRFALNGDPPRQPRLQQLADEAIQEMSDVIDRFAWLDRFEEKSLEVNLSQLDLVPFLKRQVESKDIASRVDLHTAPEPAIVQTDASLVGTILSNLIDNALKYAKDNSRIEVRVSSRETLGQPGICVAVCNQPGSSGWPEVDRVFTKFYRSPGAMRQTGTGLGLYQASLLAQRLGGEVRYAPDTHQVRFELWLPC